jgi:hypothetical protein
MRNLCGVFYTCEIPCGTGHNPLVFRKSENSQASACALYDSVRYEKSNSNLQKVILLWCLFGSG